MKHKSFGLPAIALAAALLAGCANSNPADTAGTDTDASTAASTHNAADVTFVQDMIPHHVQAITMSHLAAGRVASTQVSQLAAQISQAQDPEINQMQSLLQGWNLPVAPTDSGDMGGMNRNGQNAMPGMMSDAQLQQLTAAHGTAFDPMFLRMMTEHHNGAIEMATTELRDGQNMDAKSLAQKIIVAQRAEISHMQQLLTTM